MNLTKSAKIFFGISVLLFCMISPVDAHILKTNGSMGAVVHITPDDDPIAGQQSQFYFDIKDKNGTFKTEQCNCKVAIERADTEIFSQSLSQNTDGSSNTAVFVYTFPERGIYQVKLIGKPLLENSFDPFTLTYDIRVDREITTQIATTTKRTQNRPFILFGVLAIAICIIILTTIIARNKH